MFFRDSAWVISPSVNPLTLVRPESPCPSASMNRLENSCHCSPSNDCSSLWTKSQTAAINCRWPSCLSAANRSNSLFAASAGNELTKWSAESGLQFYHESAASVLESWFIPLLRAGCFLSAMPLTIVLIQDV